MALYATNRFPGDGSTTSYEFNFVGKYIARSHVKVYQEDNATKVRTSVPINDSNFLNDTTLRSLPVTPTGSTLVIYRDTPKPPLVDFVNGSRFTEFNLDLVARQGLFVAMEAMDAGDAEAREQLLAAIAVVTALVDDATVAVSDATAAALAAATSASNAAASASQAQTANTDAQSANTAAQAAKTGAQTAAGNSAASALAASNSATAAAGSASTANTRATAAATSATGAATSATNAAASASTATTQATNAANSAAAAATSASNASASASAAASSAASVNASNFVTVGTAQTVSGLKTFTVSPNVGNLADPESAADRALNWQSTKQRVVINGWGIQPGVTSNMVLMGWGGVPKGIAVQVDASPMGTMLVSGLAGNSGVIGALCFAHYNVNGSTVGAGAAVNGADLRPASPVSHQGISLPGVWTCLGYCVGTTDAASPAAKTMFIRTS